MTIRICVNKEERPWQNACAHNYRSVSESISRRV